MFPGVSGDRSCVLHGRIEVCPNCGSDWVFLVRPYDDKYRCDACGRCWSPATPRPKRVDPVTCPGCEDAPACFDRLQREVGLWGPPILD